MLSEDVLIAADFFEGIVRTVPFVKEETKQFPKGGIAKMGEKTILCRTRRRWQFVTVPNLPDNLWIALNKLVGKCAA